MLTQEYVKSIFDWNGSDGEMIWRFRTDRSKSWNTRYAGTVAGSIAYREVSGPYIEVGINGKSYLLHRIIWLYLHEYMPNEIDHQDGNGLNNKEYNLREASSSQNKANYNKLNRGVRQHRSGYQALISVDGIRVCLGTYKTKEEAQIVYNIAADEHYGEFARCNRLIRRF